MTPRGTACVCDIHEQDKVFRPVDGEVPTPLSEMLLLPGPGSGQGLVPRVAGRRRVPRDDGREGHMSRHAEQPRALHLKGHSVSRCYRRDTQEKTREGMERLQTG